MALLSVFVQPSDAGRLYVDGVEVPDGYSWRARVGSSVSLNVVPRGNNELDSWNDGEWFEESWSVVVGGDKSFSARLIEI